MRTLIAPIILLLASPYTLSQNNKQPTCELQDLAIEAALGDPFAQHNLGTIFYGGHKVPQDYSKAAQLWRLSSSAVGIYGIFCCYN